MKHVLKQIGCIMMTVALVISCAPLGMAWAVDEASAEAGKEAADTTAASYENGVTDIEETSDTETDTAEEAASEEDDAITEETENSDIVYEQDGDEIIIVEGPVSEDAHMAADEVSMQVDPDISNGEVALTEAEGNYTGTAIPDTGYDLATVRQIWTDEEGIEHEQYLDYTEGGGAYQFEVANKETDSVITAFFYSQEKWDGAVDLTWYDPEQTEFEISTPAQLAGLAAITNGMVDENITAEYMIKDNAGRTERNDGTYSHTYISTKSWQADLIAPTQGSDASQIRDTVWRLPEVEHYQVGGAADDVHNDFLYRTVRLTADLDMTGANWTPIGGKYAMNRDALGTEDPKVIDTRFQGVFDGQGHTVTLDCNRQAKKGFAYAMEIALIGYLGGGVDYASGNPKDTCMDYVNYWKPTVRNVVVDGTVKGRRMVGGVVGRTGETNYGVLVENCGNMAHVEATDMRGVAGIVGAAWGKCVIRNCYNTGTIISGFWEHGGIVGSNGYAGSVGKPAAGADVYNCYNAGETYMQQGLNNDLVYAGQDIGVDGEGLASYTISNCYYEVSDPQTLIEDKSGYNVGSSKRAKVKNVEHADIRAQETIDKLNANGEVFFTDTANVNGGYPVLYFQTSEYKSDPGSFDSANITLDNSDTSRGKISAAAGLNNIPYGSNIDLEVKTEKGNRFSHYHVSVNGTSEEYEVTSGDFVIAAGKNITIRPVFEDQGNSIIRFNEPQDEGVLYYVVVKKIAYYDYETGEYKSCDIAVKDGDTLEVKDRIKVQGVMNPWDDKEVKEDKNQEYTGKTGALIFDEKGLDEVENRTDTYEVTGEIEIIELSYKPTTQGKRWSTKGDTSWYKAGKKEFVITTTRQLAGIIKLCNSGVDFKGVTIKLGKDISLANLPENGGDGEERSWDGIGTVARPFRGTFDGQGHTIRYMHRNFASGYCSGGYGGLFSVTEGATIKNVNVESGTYVINEDANMECGFINGATGGGIVGNAIDTVIQNCTANVPMNKARKAGGIVGEVEGGTVIRNCTSACNINGDGVFVGGIAGYIYRSGGAAIVSCTNRGEIFSTTYKVGGILGSGEYYAATISGCVNEAPITTEIKPMPGLIQQQAVGGILGYSSGLIKISECINKGDITGKVQTYVQGGIAGAITKGSITDCYNTGKIHSENTSESAEVSGIANLDSNKSNISTVKNCYNIGEVTMPEGFQSKSVGGAVAFGNDTSNIVSNVYCSDESVAGINGSAGKMGSVVEADKLKGYAAQLGDAFIKDLDNINDGYPVLLWQVQPLTGSVALTGVTKSSDTALTVSWKKTGAGDGVELHRSLKKDSGFAKVYSGNAASFNNSKLAYGKTYYYKARVYRTIDGKTYYSGWSAVKSFSLIPPAAKFSSVKNTKGKKVTLKWKKVSGVTGYEIYRSTKKNSGFKKIATIKKAKTVKYIDKKKLKKGKTYYYKIKTYKTVSKNKGYSADSAVKKVKIKK